MENNFFLLLFSSLFIALLVSIVLTIPKKINYYINKKGELGRPFDSEFNVIESNGYSKLYLTTNNRYQTFKILCKHRLLSKLGILFLCRIAECLLTLIHPSNPGKFCWQSCFFGIDFYPLGSSRLEWFIWCFKNRWWPWYSESEVRMVMANNDGRYLRMGVMCDAQDVLPKFFE